SRTAWRMPSARRGSGMDGRARAASSAASMRVRQASSSGPVSGPGASDIVGQAGERPGLVWLLRVAEQLHPQLGLLQRLLAAPVQADALLVGGQRLLEAEFAAFHVVDEGLELLQRLLEVGDGGGFRGTFLGHGASLSDGPGSGIRQAKKNAPAGGAFCKLAERESVDTADHYA